MLGEIEEILSSWRSRLTPCDVRLCNFGSLGIMIGGLGKMAPDRRDEINSLGLKSIVSGTLTTCLMGAIVGVLT
jgi:nucleoside permease NupC